MHDNVNISKELQETKHMFDNVLLAQGRLKSGTRTGSHTDERLAEIANNILNKVLHLTSLIVRKVERVGLISREIIFQEFQPV